MNKRICVFLLVAALLVVTSLTTLAAPGDFTVVDPVTPTTNLAEPGELWLQGMVEVPDTYTVEVWGTATDEPLTPVKVASGGHWGVEASVNDPVILKLQLMDADGSPVKDASAEIN